MRTKAMNMRLHMQAAPVPFPVPVPVPTTKVQWLKYMSLTELSPSWARAGHVIKYTISIRGLRIGMSKMPAPTNYISFLLPSPPPLPTAVYEYRHAK